MPAPGRWRQTKETCGRISQDHVDRFTPAARVTFRQVFLGDADAAPVLAALAGGADPVHSGTERCCRR